MVFSKAEKGQKEKEERQPTWESWKQKGAEHIKCSSVATACWRQSLGESEVWIDTRDNDWSLEKGTDEGDGGGSWFDVMPQIREIQIFVVVLNLLALNELSNVGQELIQIWEIQIFVVVFVVDGGRRRANSFWCAVWATRPLFCCPTGLAFTRAISMLILELGNLWFDFLGSGDDMIGRNEIRNIMDFVTE